MIKKYWSGELSENIVINVIHSQSFDLLLLDEQGFCDYNNGQYYTNYGKLSYEDTDNHPYEGRFRVDVQVCFNGFGYIIIRLDEDQDSDPIVILIESAAPPSPVFPLALGNLPQKARSTAVRDPRPAHRPDRDQRSG
jgi:hypothetical protein